MSKCKMTEKEWRDWEIKSLMNDMNSLNYARLRITDEINKIIYIYAYKSIKGYESEYWKENGWKIKTWEGIDDYNKKADKVAKIYKANGKVFHKETLNSMTLDQATKIVDTMNNKNLSQSEQEEIIGKILH